MPDLIVDDFPSPGEPATIGSFPAGSCFLRATKRYLVNTCPGIGGSGLIGACVDAPFAALVLDPIGAEIVVAVAAPHFGPA